MAGRVRAGVTVAALAVVTVGGCAERGGGEGPRYGRAGPAPGAAAESTAPSSGEISFTYEKVVRDVLPSVVQINTRTGLGSGVVFDERGHIVTNAHVVGGAKTMEVTPATGGRPLAARLIASYPPADIAVIRVAGGAGLRPARFGDSSDLRVGRVVLAMGNPLGLSGSVTNGIISALNRSVSEPGQAGTAAATLSGAIQTSAAINPGNSGGALVDLTGEVIGIPTLTAANPQMGGGQAAGIGFAIPSNTVTDLAGQIIRHGRVVNSRRAALGVRVQTVIGANGAPAGAGVVSVDAGGPAARAGIEPGDVVVAVAGSPTPTAERLAEALARHRPGEKVQVGLRRAAGGGQARVNVTLGELPSR